MYELQVMHPKLRINGNQLVGVVFRFMKFSWVTLQASRDTHLLSRRHA